MWSGGWAAPWHPGPSHGSLCTDSHTQPACVITLPRGTSNGAP